MSDAVRDEIRIEIDGQVWTAFESVMVTKSMQDLCGTFSFRTVKQGAIMPFANGATVRVLIGTPKDGFNVVLNGFIFSMNPRHDAKSHTIIVSGRDKTADVLDSTIGGNFTFKSPISLVSLTQNVLKKLGITGINVNIDVNVSDLTEADLEMNDNEIMSSYTGERVFDFISRYARKKQVLLTTDQNGDLLFTRTSNRAIATRLVYNSTQSNMLSGEGIFDDSRRYHSYTCFSQENTTVLNSEGKAVPPTDEVISVGAALDDEVRKTRTFSFIGDSPYAGVTDLPTTGLPQTLGIGTDAYNRAVWESNVRRAKSFYYIAEMIGYRAYEDGIIWRPNLLVQVDDEDVQISSQLLVNKVTYFKNLSPHGSVTQLELVSKDTFDLLEITGRASRKKASERVEGRKFAGAG